MDGNFPFKIKSQKIASSHPMDHTLGRKANWVDEARNFGELGIYKTKNKIQGMLKD
jgi:hypothetical protein